MSATGGKPRLLVTASTLPRWRGDAEPRFVLDLALALQGAFDITILAPLSPGAAPEEMVEGVRIVRYRYAPLRRLETLAAPGAILPNIKSAPWRALLVPFLIASLGGAMARLLRRERFDLVHCHWLAPQGLAYALIRLFMRCPPALLTCHGGDAFTLNAPPFRLLKKTTIASMAGATAVSPEAVRYLSELHPGCRATMAPMGVDLERFSSRRLERPRTGGLPTILFVGRLAEKKGLPVLIAALRRSGVRAQFSIVGDGPLRGALERECADLISAGRVVFTGAISHEDLPAEFARADLFCAPFVVAADGDREGMPTVLLEAAASGVPILASNVGGCRELIVNGETGWLTPPGDVDALAAALGEALGEPELAARYAAAARRKVQAYAWPRVAARYEAALRSILTPKERPIRAEHHPLFGALIEGDSWFPSPAHVLRRRAVLDALEGLEPGRWLDLGCGAGRWLVDFARLGHDGVGVEPDEASRSLAVGCVGAFEARFDIVQSVDAVPDSAFDYASAIEVIEHLEEPEAALAIWRRKLKPGGLFIATVPAFQSLWGASDEWAGHVQRFEPAAFTNLLAAAGFEVELCRVHGFPAGNAFLAMGAISSRLKMRARDSSDRDAATMASGRDRSIELKLSSLMKSPIGAGALRLGAALQRRFPARGTGLVAIARNRRTAAAPALAVLKASANA
ncbi:MAG: glycosyltransferase [Parvularculaceae bacterium]